MKKAMLDPFSGRMVRRLWWPAILSAIGLSIGDIADALVIGRRMGESGLTAVSICLPLYMIINILIYGLGTGGSIHFSRMMSEGKPEAAVRNFNHLLLGGAAIGAVIALVLELFGPQVVMLLGASSADEVIYSRALTYARLIILSIPFFVIAYVMQYYLIADGHEKLAAAAFVAGNIADISLNILLVLVLDLGVAGAALSTLAGQVLTILLYLPALMGKRKHTLCFRPAPIDLREVGVCFRTGFSTSVQFIGQFFFFMLVNRLLLDMAGENGVAVFDVLQNTSYVVMYLCEATVNALQPIVSTLYGEKNRVGMRNALRTGLILTLCSVSLLVALIALRPDWICLLFGVEAEESLTIGALALRIYCTGALASGLGVILEGYEQARGNEKRAALLTVLRKGVVLFPCIVLFALGGSNVIWWFFPVTEFVSLLIYAVAYRYVDRHEEAAQEERIYRAIMGSQIEELPALMSEIEAFCEKWEISMRQQMVVNLVAEEVCSAIVREGFASISDGSIQLTLIAEENGEFEFHIRDNAVQFNPFALEEKRMNSGDEEMDISAIGIQMIRKKVKTFFYRQYQGFNSLVIRV